MRKYHPSPAMVVALLALFVALGGVGYAASDTTDSPQHGTIATRHSSAQPGTHAAKAVPELTRAYALLEPACGKCDPHRRGYTPLVSAQSMNVALGSARPGAQLGTWCFILKKSIDLSTATVVVSALRRGYVTVYHASFESAQWTSGAPDCSPNQIEVQTFGYTVEGGKLIAVPDSETAFSFMVDAK